MTDGVNETLPQLGNYELVRRVAQGGMADIYLARQLGIGQFERHVAVKVLSDARTEDPEACALFLDEARLLAMLNHHNIAGVFEVDVQNGVHYLAMEYVHGADLREVLAAAKTSGRGIPLATSLSIVAAAAAGLDHAHRRCGPDGKPLHLVHRDVSLSNVMVGYDGTVKVVDFGIASATVSSVHTQPGIVRGKASYMSPEQCLGDKLDLRTDVFALGIVLYELTTGHRCFQGDSDFDRMLAVVRGDYVPPTVLVPDYPVLLEQVVKTALSLNPNDRYPSAAALIDALERVARSYGWAGGGGAIARLMEELFGKVAAPWARAAESVELAPKSTRPGVGIGPRTVEIKRPRRFPHATGGESLVPANDDLAYDVDDDAPTRGRRSVPKIFARPASAPGPSEMIEYEPMAA